MDDTFKLRVRLDQEVNNFFLEGGIVVLEVVCITYVLLRSMSYLNVLVAQQAVMSACSDWLVYWPIGARAQSLILQDICIHSLLFDLAEVLSFTFEHQQVKIAY